MNNTALYNAQNAALRTARCSRPWTRAEVEIARDRTMTVREAARVTGRTMNTIKHMRRSARADALVAQ